jgi:biuret amidohydrolase
MSWNAREHDPEYPFDLVSPNFKLSPKTTALLVIDMQVDYLSIGKTSPLGANYPELARTFNARVETLVKPGNLKLIQFFRKHGLTIAYTRNGCMTSRGDEMSGRLRKLNNPPKIWRGTAGYEISPELFPHKEDLVVDKLTSGAFTSTQLDHALRNYGVTDVVITGVFTDMCVLGSARTAAELGYNSLICEDGCASLTQRAHDEALLMHARRFGRVSMVEEVISEVGESETPRAAVQAKASVLS